MTLKFIYVSIIIILYKNVAYNLFIYLFIFFLSIGAGAISSGESNDDADADVTIDDDEEEEEEEEEAIQEEKNSSKKDKQFPFNKKVRRRTNTLIPDFPQDPHICPNLDIPSGKKFIYQKHWNAIRHHYFEGRVQRMYNIRWKIDSIESEPPNWEEILSIIYRRQKFKFKINISNSLLLQNRKNGVLEFYHSSLNNNALFDCNFLIENEEDFIDLVQRLKSFDHIQAAYMQRPSTEWDVIEILSSSLYVYPIAPFPLGCPQPDIPEHIKNNLYIHTLTKNNYKNFDDYLCFFRCVSLTEANSNPKNIEIKTRKNFAKYIAANPNMSIPFRGVTLEELDKLEEIYNLQIFVYEYDNDNDNDDDDDDDDDNDDDEDIGDDNDDVENIDSRPPMLIIRKSKANYSNILNLLKVEQHFCFITNVNAASRSFSCKKCKTLFFRHHLLIEHACSGGGQKQYYPGGVYSPTQSIIERLRENGLDIPPNYVFPFRITYDFESYFKEVDEQVGGKTRILNKHVPLSVSIASNVPGFEAPVCFITNSNEQELIDRFINYLETISFHSFQILKKQFAHIYDELDARCMLLDYETDQNNPNQPNVHYENPSLLVNVLNKYLSVIPVIGFNSSCYDLNCIKRFLFKKLLESPYAQTKKKKEKTKDEMEDVTIGNSIDYILKAGNSFKAIATTKFIFLDIKFYLAPGYSYAQYLSAYKIEETKGFFPYEYMTNIDRLKERSLPPHEAFYSKLKNSNITKEEYDYCQKIFKEQNMHTLRDFLIWYNNKDVVPFLKAIEKQSKFYQSLGLDIFKDGIGIPSLTLKYLFSTIPEQTYFSLFSPKNKHIVDLFRQNLVGGPSIIYNRYHEAGITRLRNENGKLVGSIVGYDANALYLGCIANEMPTRTPTIYTAPDWKPSCVNFFTLSQQYLSYMEHLHKVKIISKFRSKERRIGGRLVDGYCPTKNTVYQFHGCYHHGHRDCIKLKNHPTQFNTLRNKSFDDLYTDTINFSKKLREEVGVTLYEMWECEWEQEKRSDKKLQEFLETHFSHSKKNNLLWSY